MRGRTCHTVLGLKAILLALACASFPLALLADDNLPFDADADADAPPFNTERVAPALTLPMGAARRRLPYTQRQPAILDVGALYGQVTVRGITRSDTRPPARLQAGSLSFQDATQFDEGSGGSGHGQSGAFNESGGIMRSTRWLKSKAPRGVRNPAGPHDRPATREHHHTASRTLLGVTPAVETLPGRPADQKNPPDAQATRPGLEPWTMNSDTSTEETLSRAPNPPHVESPFYGGIQGRSPPAEILVPFLNFPGESLGGEEAGDLFPAGYLPEEPEEELFAKIRRSLLQEPSQSLPDLASTSPVAAEVGAPSGGPADGSESGEVAAPLATWLRRIVDTGESGAPGPDGGSEVVMGLEGGNVSEAAAPAPAEEEEDPEPWLAWAEPHGDLTPLSPPTAGRGLNPRLRRSKINREKAARELAQRWMDYHDQLVAEVEENDAQPKAKAWDVVMLGSSMLESWRGTMMGLTYPGHSKIPLFYDRYFHNPWKPTKFLPHVLAISGDGVRHLMWRILHGELPRNNTPQVVVVSVGSADISLPHGCTLAAAAHTTKRITQLLTYIRKQLPLTYLIYIGILPKGEDWPNLCAIPIQAVNQGVKNFTELKFQDPNPDIAPQRDKYLVYHDFADIFIREKESADKRAAIQRAKEEGIKFAPPPPAAPSPFGAVKRTKLEINPDLMPDTLHPNAAGMQRIAAQLEPLIAKYVNQYRTEERDRGPAGT